MWSLVSNVLGNSLFMHLTLKVKNEICNIFPVYRDEIEKKSSRIMCWFVVSSFSITMPSTVIFNKNAVYIEKGKRGRPVRLCRKEYDIRARKKHNRTHVRDR